MNLIEFAPPEALQVAVPNKTASYQPVSNRDLLDAMGNCIGDYGLVITGADMSTAANGQQFMGTIKFSPGGNNDLQMQLGFRNSYNKSFAVGFGAGANVMVCSNGLFISEVQSVRKHTTRVWDDISAVCSDQLSYIDDTFQQIKNDVMDMKSIEMTKPLIQKLIWELNVEQKVITNTQRNILQNELYHSENFKMLDSDHEFEDRSMWNFYNNVTESLKKSHPANYFRNHASLHKMVMQYVC